MTADPAGAGREGAGREGGGRCGVGVDVGGLLARAAEVLGALAAVDLDGVSDAELEEAVVGLHRLRGRVELAEARVLACWDGRGVGRASGARTAAGWLVRHQRLPAGVARQRLRHARALRALPALEGPWADGELDRSHVTTLLGVRTERTAPAFDMAYEDLVGTARTEVFSRFKARCDLFELLVDPDGAEQRADEGRAARELHLSQSFEGMWFAKATLDPISGEIVATTLRMIEQELFETDWATAKARVGRDPLVVELDRNPAQRRADAWVEMATRARTEPAGGRRPAPLFSVVVGYETFTGPVLELFNRTIITPGSAARWLTTADIERIVFDTPSRVIDVGIQRRLFTGGTRRAVEIRDRDCYHPGCDTPPERLQIDHIHPHATGGPTTHTNGRPACSFHNRWRNHHPDDPDPP